MGDEKEEDDCARFEADDVEADDEADMALARTMEKNMKFCWLFLLLLTATHILIERHAADIDGHMLLCC